ncbi:MULTISPECIES: heme exporter protein CcmD [unclassified Cupriavidus]|nr:MULTISPECIES: heme exporter protein CcmD [unclassified Cupriavidus]
MSGHIPYLVGAFGVACVAIALEMVLLRRRSRRHADHEDDTP